MISKQIALQFINKGKNIAFSTTTSEIIIKKGRNNEYEVYTYEKGDTLPDCSTVTFEQLIQLLNEEVNQNDYRVVEQF